MPVLPIVLGAVLGASLVFPSTINVRVRSSVKVPTTVVFEGYPPIRLAPGRSEVVQLPRWKFTRFAFAFGDVDPSGLRPASSEKVLGIREYLLYESLNLTVHANGFGVVR